MSTLAGNPNDELHSDSYNTRLKTQISSEFWRLVLPISREILEICSREISRHFPGIPGYSWEINLY